jgi:alkanesulfonate monooxygenase SsuD/methylene tetrahydromethanopterin reductase-like flavin-dependent oxidoreductase (luciferase family)
MDIGIGLPATIPDVDGEQHAEWARRADQRGFSTLGVIDRIVYPNWEPLMALAQAAGVTERIGLTSSIVIGPFRSTAVLAKQAATLDVISGGRFTLGIAPGGRPNDYEAAGVDFHTRGKRFEQQLADLKRIWTGSEIGPKPVQEGGPPILVGGSVEATFQRAARHGAGWIAGGAPPDAVKASADTVRQAWEAAGREGEPRIVGLMYFALGPNAGESAQRYLKDYYAWLGDMADMIAASAAKDAATIKQYLAAYEQAGLDEIICFPCDPDVEEVERLAAAAL